MMRTFRWVSGDYIEVYPVVSKCVSEGIGFISSLNNDMKVYDHNSGSNSDRTYWKGRHE
jgi:hypothetical protein